MKRLISIVFIALTIFMAKSQITNPDFAYPKTTASNADKALKDAIADKDAYKALNALIVYTLAQDAIDNDELPKSIRLVEQTQSKFSDSDLYGIFDALLAQLYMMQYRENSWIYDQRSLPLTPYPDDLTEWSGKQYEHKIRSLCMTSIDDANIEKLSRLSITDYPGIVTCGKESAVFFPTLADFAFQNILNVYGERDTNQWMADILSKARDNAKDLAAKIQWQCQIDCMNERQFDALKADYDRYHDCEYSGLFIAKLFNYLDAISKEKTFKEIATEYLDRYPNSMFKEVLDFDLKNVLKLNIYIRVPDVCGVNQEIKIDVDNTNAVKYAINAYYVGENFDRYANDNQKRLKQIVSNNKPQISLELKDDSIPPFKYSRTVTMSFDRPGYYLIVPQVPGIKDLPNLAVTRCVPVLPIIINGAVNKAQIFTVDSKTGAPVSGVDVSAKIKNKKHNIGVTDAEGIVDYVPNNNETWSRNVSLNVKGKVYNFDDLNINLTKEYTDDNIVKAANVLTERALYHPGDEVNALGIFYESVTKTDRSEYKTLLVGKEVEFILRNANWQNVDTVRAVTDEYGRATAKFRLPTDGLTGQYAVCTRLVENNYSTGSRSFTVSDYRMPDFEVKIKTVECDTPVKGAVTVTGDAISYSGMPLADTQLTLTVRESYWFWRSSNGEQIYSAELNTDQNGTFSFVVPDSVFKDNKAEMYSVTVDAVSITGSTSTATRTFAFKQKFHLTSEIRTENVDGQQPLTPDVTITAADGTRVELPLIWTIKQKNDTIATGTYYGSIDISALKPGRYTLCLRTKDPDLANETMNSLVVYNVASGIVPSDKIWIKQERYELTDSESIDILLATPDSVNYIYYTLVAKGDIISTRLAKYEYGYHNLNVDLPSGYDNIIVKLASVTNCNTFTRDINISKKETKGLRIEGESFRDNLIPGAEETWNLRIVNTDGTPVNAALVLDMYNKALEALVYQPFDINFRSYPFYSNCFYNFSRNYGHVTTVSESVEHDFKAIITYPQFNFYDYYNRGFWGVNPYFLSMGQRRAYGRSYRTKQLSLSAKADADVMVEEEVAEDAVMVTGSSNIMYNTAAPMSGAVEMVATVDSAAMADEGVVEGEEGSIVDAQSFDYRDSDVPMAIWAPMLTTDANGNVQYTFTVPNANTTWRLKAVAWSDNMEIGSLMRDFVASKPVMVQPNLPRFLRSGDKATILASVMNNTDSVNAVTTVVEIFNPLTSEVLSKRVFTDTIAPKQSVKVSIDIDAVDDMAAIGYRVRSGNGQFSDGEQNVIRILPSESSLIETMPFYLNPGETKYTTQLPSEHKARLSLTFCENPAWTIVSALPGLRTQICDYANSAAAALYSAAIARGIVKENPAIASALKQWAENPNDSVLVSMLEKNEDLKIALLNSTPWVSAAQSDTERMANLSMIFDRKEVDASIAAALKILEKLQKADGGWAWSDWCDESSVWVTANVLAMCGDLKTLGWLPDNKSLSKMIDRAVKYYDSKVEDTDLLYCLTRPAFKNISVSNNGEKVINATLSEIRKNWKKTMDPAYKAMQAEALYLHGDKATANKLMASLSEFGVYTPSQGLKFPNVNALYSYAVILDAYSMILPDSKEVDGLRQQLIVRKQGTDWGDAVVTTEVVKSILSSGSRWTVDAKGAEIVVDGTIIEPKGAIETATGSLTADLSGFAGKTMTVSTTGVGPAYGAVYAQFNKQMEEVKASSCDDLDIEKQLYVRRGGEWAIADQLQVGDRVKVQLTIHCKRNLSYVSIIDERPATFEPVNQLPGWLYSEGLGFYRESRDAQTDLHVIYMSPGTYLLTYEMNVNLAGTFSSGVATIQSQYAPEISAHSSGSIVNVK